METCEWPYVLLGLLTVLILTPLLAAWLNDIYR